MQSFKGSPMRKISRKCVLALIPAIPLLLSSCALLSRPAPSTLVALRAPVPELALFETALPVQLVVATPDAADALKNEHIALLFDEREIKFLAGVKWETPVPGLIQRQLIRYLEASGAFSAVGSESAGLRSRYRLQSEVQRLHLCYSTGEELPTAEIRLRVAVLELSRGEILGGKTIICRKKALGNGQNQLLDALDDAVGRAMLEMARWTAALVKNLEDG
jgi:cholesterol transport system auxiliary component